MQFVYWANSSSVVDYLNEHFAKILGDNAVSVRHCRDHPLWNYEIDSGVTLSRAIGLVDTAPSLQKDLFGLAVVAAAPEDGLRPKADGVFFFDSNVEVHSV